MITCTIAEVPVVVANDKQFSLQKPLGARSILQLTVLDQYGELNFQRGDPVSFSDPDTGEVYNGFVNSSMPTKFGLINVFVGHTVTFYDDQYRLQKRTNSDNYFNEFAGDIAVDFARKLAEEGVRVAAAVRRDTTVDDWNQGILSGVTGTGDSADGALQLVKAGSDLTITEATTSDFSTGTLTNVTATSDTLTPTTVNALKFTTTLVNTFANSFVALKFWDGLMTIGSNDTLHYDIWVSSTSPQSMVNIDFTLSDGSTLGNSGLFDQNGLGADETTDLSNYAKDQWYSRSIALTGLNGKKITVVTISAGGTSAGTYMAYIKNCYLQSQSGSPFFGTATTVPDVNPPQTVNSNGYAPSQTSATVVPVWVPGGSVRVSSGYSIDSVKLLQSSLITWRAILPSNSNVVLYASYDNGNTYAQCTNNSPLPALPAGSNVAGLTLKLKEVFTAVADPTILPTLNEVTLSLISAPNPTSAKSDIVTPYATSTAWNNGTYAGLELASDNAGVSPTNPTTRNWSNNQITNQTFFQSTNITESASSGNYTMTTSSLVGSAPQAQSRLDFVGSAQNFTLEIDVKMSSITANHQLGITYRQTYWDSVANTFGYFISLNSADLVLLKGGNGPTPSFTQIGIQSGVNPSANTTYHIKIVVTGNNHQVFWNGSGSAGINVTDSTYPNAGWFGFLGIFTHTGTFTWDNLSVNVPATTGTWTSNSISLSSLGTCGGSAIAWTETNTNAVSSVNNAIATVSTSIDGGSTYQTCTNGDAISGLSSGISLSGKSLIVKVQIDTPQGSALPEVSRLVWRVLGAYPGSSGTRSTVPLVLDSVNRSNATGTWNTTDDGQSYTKIGTGTIGISGDEAQISNTTGDVHMRPGSRTGTDQEGTVRFSLSASTMSAGLELRYSDANNYYRLQASTTAVSIVKRVAGTTTTLATVSMALDIGAYYHMRFRVTGSNPVSLSGNVWEDGQLENTINPTTYQWDDSLWTISASD